MTTPSFVTSTPWPRTLLQYGATDTYYLAAEWLKDCATVADWGGASGFFGSFLDGRTKYTVVDGTLQNVGRADHVLADLADYRESSDGILLRHVLDNTHEWEPILTNALQAFRRRMVVVTFTPAATVTTRFPHRNGWPYWHFKPDDLRRAMGDLLVRDEAVPTTHPERVYYMERPCA